MPFQSHLRDFSTPKECKNTCPDCLKRRAAAAESAAVANTLPEEKSGPPENLHIRLRDRFASLGNAKRTGANDDGNWDGRL